MRCPYCDADNQSYVVDTTRTEDGIRRRRECKTCGRRFSTLEKVLRSTPLLIKSNGDREAFDREKLIRGIQISCGKRPISAAGITALVDQIETHLQNLGRDEVSSRVVGDMVIAGLKELDPIAYIRYAIVYLGLDSMTSVSDLLNNLLADENSLSGARSPDKLPVTPAVEPPAQAAAPTSTGAEASAEQPPQPVAQPEASPPEEPTPDSGQTPNQL
ncbi:MAG: transcriptional repressor NrdR [Chloroflexi bacterium]|nr:transcriptional repressor NrdR [Chloroflexota bacterium]